MRILVCGSRGFADYKKLSKELATYQITHLISGGAKGADGLAERWANENKIPKTILNAEWEKYGKRAGYVRNVAMLNESPDIIVAFWDGQSRGTKMMIDLAIRAQKRVHVIK